jgi:hypothetical protein
LSFGQSAYNQSCSKYHIPHPDFFSYFLRLLTIFLGFICNSVLVGKWITKNPKFFPCLVPPVSRSMVTTTWDLCAAVAHLAAASPSHPTNLSGPFLPNLAMTRSARRRPVLTARFPRHTTPPQPLLCCTIGHRCVAPHCRH